MESEFLNRRQLARGAMLGGASLLFAASAVADPPPSHERTFLNARELGAAGDGHTNDTAPLQKALDAAGRSSGAVFLPPGVYLTDELHVCPGTAVMGVPAWNYSGPGGSVLRLAGPQSACLLNLTDARGSSIEGLALDGRGLGSGVHGMATLRKVFAAHEDGFRIEKCQVANFSGNGLNLDCAWCFSVRHCMLAYNAGDGLTLHGWDGFILDNWFSGNKRAGFAARGPNASVTFTANRVEWNGEENMTIAGGDGYQIVGNFFDRAGTVGVALRSGRGPCTQIALTGNFIKRSGKAAQAGTHDSAQLLLEGCEGLTCIGNTLQAGRDDGGKGVWSPSYGIIYRGLRNCVVRDNVLHDGAITQLLLDLGGHHEGVVVDDNPGRLFTNFGRGW